MEIVPGEDGLNEIVVHPLVRGWFAFVTVAPFQLAMSPPKQALAWSLATGAGTVCLSAAIDYFNRKR